MSDDLDPTEDELREAAALAQALEHGSGKADMPEDALEVAALLRYSVDGGTLGADRESAVRGEVLRSRPRSAPLERPWWMRWLPITAIAATAGAAALALLLKEPEGAMLPKPPAGLLRAQLEAEQQGVESVEAEMAPYRVSMYESLHARYGR